MASTTSVMSTSSFASSLAPSDAPADEHVVLPGDTLAGLCIRYGVSARVASPPEPPRRRSG